MNPALQSKCSQCGVPLAPGVPSGLCLGCLLGIGLKDQTVGDEESSPANDVAAAVAPDIFDRYRVIEKIGEGGCGIVYRAEQLTPVRREVALKVIKLGMDTKMVIARFEAERQALALMDHPSIAKVFDAGATQSGRPFFAMQLVRGERITDYCDRKQLSIPHRLELFGQVCLAIQHAHQKGVIHRDIKPSNILVVERDDKPTPKIIDFGIAKATTRQRLADQTVYTVFDQFVGTPAYMSPEQAGLTGEDIDTRSDVYSLGVLLYELLTGRPPFDPERLRQAGLGEVCRIIQEEEPTRPSVRLTSLTQIEVSETARRRLAHVPRLVSELRGDLDLIAMKALEKDRAHRYPSAGSLAADVERHLKNEPITACPPGGYYRLKKFVRRNRTASVAIAAIACSLIGATLFSTLQATRARRAELDALTAAMRTQQVVSFLDDMLKGIEPSVAAGRDNVLIKDLLDRTAARVEEELKDQPEVRVVLLQILGETYRRIRQDAEAERLLGAAEELHKQGFSKDLASRADLLDSIGFIFRRESKLDEAEASFREALEVRKALPGNQQRGRASSTYNLATIALARGELTEAESLFNEALKLRRQIWGETNYLVANTLNSLAEVKIQQNDLAAAETLSREALAIRRELYGEKHPDVANSLSRLGEVLRDRGDLAAAFPLLREALEISRRLYGENFPDMVPQRLGLSKALVQAGQFAEAEGLLQTNYLIISKMPGRAGLQYFFTIHRLAEAQFARGNYTNAEPMLLDGWKQLQARTYRGRDTESNFCFRLVQLYDATGRTNDAAAWRQRLGSLPDSSNPVPAK